jgi:NADP-dependent 3-hydroxy acid dehydrogenase YdfG
MSELKTDDWNAMIEVNIKGVLNTIAAVLPEFIAQKKGHIIVTSSRAGTMSVPGNAVYCGTKHFVRAMLDSFRSESVRDGTNIRTTTIYPGAIKTELLNTVRESEAKNMVSQFYENVGLTPDVIANAVLYAVSQPDNVAVTDLVICPSKEG